tara:strand:+ start:1298 stop:1450 length:153 start_codon:yes stop_codon:yes gene_type:complete
LVLARDKHNEHLDDEQIDVEHVAQQSGISEEESQTLDSHEPFRDFQKFLL